MTLHRLPFPNGKDPVLGLEILYKIMERKQGEESDGPFGGRERESLPLTGEGVFMAVNSTVGIPFQNLKKDKKVKVEPVGLKY